MTEDGQFTCPMMGTTAGFHGHLNRRELFEEADHLRTAKIDPQRRLVSLVDAVQRENRLRRVDPYPFILRHGRLQLVVCSSNSGTRCRGAVHPNRRSVARPRWQDVAATQSRSGVAVVAGRGP